MTVVDFIIVIFCLFLVLKGLWKGVLSEGFGLLALFAGLAAASNFHVLVSDRLESVFSQQLLCDTIGYSSVFMVVWLAVKIMGWMLDKSMGEAETNLLSRLAGGILGLTKGLLIVSMVVFIAEAGFPENKITGHNLSTPICLKIGHRVTSTLPFLFSNPLESKN